MLKLHQLKIFAATLLLCLTATAASAQCAFRNTAFKSGERLSYNLYFNWQFVWVTVGTASFDTDQTTYRLDEQLRNYAVGMGMTGASKEQLLDAMQIDEATYQAVMRPQAEFEIKTELLLDAIVKAEGLEITDEEVEQAVQDMAGEYGMEAEQIKNYVNEDVMRTDLARRKAGEIIRETAVDKEPEPAEDEAPAAGEASAGEETPVAEEAPADEAKEAE